MRLALLCLTLVSCTPAKLAGDFIVTPIRLPVVGAPKQPHSELKVTTQDGLTLRGWVFPAEKPKGVVVLLHGKDTNRQHFLERGLRMLELGYTVVAYDQRGHGESDRTTITYGVKEVGDLQNVLDAVRPEGPVVVIGESLGAAVALQAAAVDSRISGVVAAASFSNLRRLLEEKTPFFFDEKARADTFSLAEVKAGFELDAVSPEKSAALITVPTLLVHGTSDTFISITHSQRIFEALPGKKELVRLDGVAHMDVLLHAEGWKQIERFVTAL